MAEADQTKLKGWRKSFAEAETDGVKTQKRLQVGQWSWLAVAENLSLQYPLLQHYSYSYYMKFFTFHTQLFSSHYSATPQRTLLSLPIQ